jgi:hypothetical protein
MAYKYLERPNQTAFSQSTQVVFVRSCLDSLYASRVSAFDPEINMSGTNLFLLSLHFCICSVWAKILLLAQDGMVANGGPAAQRGTQALPRKAELVQLKLSGPPRLALSLQTSKSQLPLFFFCCMARTLFLPAMLLFSQIDSYNPQAHFSLCFYLIVHLFISVVSCGHHIDRPLKRNVDRIRRGRNEFDVSRLTETQDYR